MIRRLSTYFFFLLCFFCVGIFCVSSSVLCFKALHDSAASNSFLSFVDVSKIVQGQELLTWFIENKSLSVGVSFIF